MQMSEGQHMSRVVVGLRADTRYMLASEFSADAMRRFYYYMLY